jgi:hypothetical protein
MKVTIKKKTDQLNYEDFLGGVTKTVTITGYRELNGEQDCELSIAEDKRYWRPPVTVVKQLTALWGDESDDWIGRRVTLAGDPDVMFGGQKVGGIRLTHMSNIGNKPVSMSLTVTRGKKRTFTVQPLPDAASVDPRIEQLKAEWRAATPERRAEIEAEVATLSGGTQ